MTRVETLTGVPDDQVDEVVGDFESEGATVVKTQQADGTWTVVATFSEQAAIAKFAAIRAGARKPSGRKPKARAKAKKPKKRRP